MDMPAFGFRGMHLQLTFPDGVQGESFVLSTNLHHVSNPKPFSQIHHCHPLGTTTRL